MQSTTVVDCRRLSAAKILGHQCSSDPMKSGVWGHGLMLNNTPQAPHKPMPHIGPYASSADYYDE
uniref:Uncharacterized protein n=1 Tax=Romanomermis culicivorax TaxID=13658 RepID=A0A915J220_ROMCU